MRDGLTPDEMIPIDDHLDAVNALRAEYLGRYMAAIREIERKDAEIAEWRQAAQVEAGLRREFLDRAEKAEAEVERLRAIIACEQETPEGPAGDRGQVGWMGGEHDR